MVSSLPLEGCRVSKSRGEELPLKKTPTLQTCFQRARRREHQFHGLDFLRCPFILRQSGYGWPASTGLSAPSATVWGKRLLAHSGGKTGLNGAGAGGKSRGRQGVRWEVSEAACAMRFSLMGRELNRPNTDVILNDSLHMSLK